MSRNNVIRLRVNSKTYSLEDNGELNEAERIQLSERQITIPEIIQNLSPQQIDDRIAVATKAAATGPHSSSHGKADLPPKQSLNPSGQNTFTRVKGSDSEGKNATSKSSNTSSGEESHMHGNYKPFIASSGEQSIASEKQNATFFIQNSDSVEQKVDLKGQTSKVNKTDDISKNAQNGTPNWATLINLIKSNIGTGILTLPKAISDFGLLAGILGLLFLGAISIYCMHLLVNCSRMMVYSQSKDTEKKKENEITEDPPITSLTYAQTIECVFKMGPKTLRGMAPSMRVLVNVLLIFSQFGFCCVYILFVADSFSEILKITNTTQMMPTTVMLIEWPVLIAINLFSSIKALSVVTVVSCILQVLGLALMLKYFYTGDLASSHHYYINPNVSQWPLFFGTAMYSLEGIGVAMDHSCVLLSATKNAKADRILSKKYENSTSYVFEF